MLVWGERHQDIAGKAGAVLFMFNFPKSLVVNPRGCIDLHPLSVLQQPFPVHLLECDNISRGSSSQLESKAVGHRCFNLHFPTAGLFHGL